jgi:putative ABC transport system permease protein
VSPTRDFFEMFEVPFLYGAPWGLADENAARDVLVISRSLSEKIFGAGTNPVGKSVRFDDTEWRIVGVVDTWKPMPRYYRLINGNGGGFVGMEDIFVPSRPRSATRWATTATTTATATARPSRLAGLAEVRVRLHPVLVRRQERRRPGAPEGIPRRVHHRAEEARAAIRARSTCAWRT